MASLLPGERGHYTLHNGFKTLPQNRLFGPYGRKRWRGERSLLLTKLQGTWNIWIISHLFGELETELVEVLQSDRLSNSCFRMSAHSLLWKPFFGRSGLHPSFTTGQHHHQLHMSLNKQPSRVWTNSLFIWALLLKETKTTGFTKQFKIILLFWMELIY